MTDQIDAVNPNNIGPEWDGLPIVPITVLANRGLLPLMVFDVETGNASPAAAAACVLRRSIAGLASVGYTNRDWIDLFTTALANVGIEWSGVDQLGKAGMFLWAADPDVVPGQIPSWCPVIPVAVQDRPMGTYDLSTTFGRWPGRVAGYIDGPRSMWPAEAWLRFTPVNIPVYIPPSQRRSRRMLVVQDETNKEEFLVTEDGAQGARRYFADPQVVASTLAALGQAQPAVWPSELIATFPLIGPGPAAP